MFVIVMTDVVLREQERNTSNGNSKFDDCKM